ncbi:MAG: hypothetical protein RSF68_03905 [Myroides sp.]
MKKFFTVLFFSIVLISCKDKEPKQYSLTSNDVKKLEELTCHLLKQYNDVEKDLNAVRYFQSGVTNLGDQLYLSESANSSDEVLSNIENLLMSLKKVGINCNNKDVGLSEEQVKSRIEFLEAIKTNMENNSTWRDGLKIRSIDDINSQTDFTAQLSSQIK